MSNNKSALSGSIALAGDFEIDGLLIGTSSWAIKAQTSSFFDGTSIEVADLRVTNTASIEYLNVVYQSSSVIYSSGSNIFGDSPSDTQTLHGQVNIIDNVHISGTLQVDGGISGNLTGSIQGNADTATSASHALIADNVANPPSLADVLAVGNTGDNIELSGYLSVRYIGGAPDFSMSSGNIQNLAVHGNLEADLNGNADSATFAQNAEASNTSISASHALIADVASYVENAQTASYFLTSSVTSASFALSASHVVGAKDVGFSKEWHVSVGSGSDATGNGSLSKPFATLGKAFSVVGGTGEQIVVHPGLYLEPSASLTMPNVSIVSANFNAGGVVYINGSITIAPGSSSTRISGILFNNLIHSGSAGLYLDKVQVKANYTKIGSGYSEIVNTDLQATGSVVFRGGTAVIQGDKVFAPVVSGSGTALYIKDVVSCVAPSAVAGGTLVLVDSQIYPAVSGTAAVNSQAGTVTYIYNSQITTTTGLPERIAVSGFLGYDDVQFNKNLSTLGTSLNTKAHFQSLDANLLTATGSLFGTASWSVNSNNARTASFIDSQNLVLSNLTITNTASIAYLDVRYQSSSIIYSSGSNIFGDAADDTQTLNGQVNIINDAQIDGDLVVLGSITGDLIGSASYALSASDAQYAVSASDAQFAVSSSDAQYSVSASHALIADDLVNIPSLQAITTAGNSTSQSISIGVDIEMGSSGVVLDYTYLSGQSIRVNYIRFDGLFGTPPDQNYFVIGNQYVLEYPNSSGQTVTKTIEVTGFQDGNIGGYWVMYNYISGDTGTNTGLIISITTASSPAEYAFGQGQGVKVSANSQHVVGLWNSPVTGSGAFVVGNGSDDANRSNLIEASGNSVTFNGAINFLNLPSYSNDSEASAGGVAIGGIYRNGNFIQIRIS